MDATLRDLVRQRAGERCEYCRLPERAMPPGRRFHIEHIVARQHHGGDEPANLALACDRCNLHKGPNLTAIDPLTGDIVLLFNPRLDVWETNFEIRMGRVVGLTEMGRATVELLNMNERTRVRLRRRIEQA